MSGIIPNSAGFAEQEANLREAWSAAARAAAAASRGKRGSGKVIRGDAARTAFAAAQPKPNYSAKGMRAIGQRDATHEGDLMRTESKFTSKKGETPGRREAFAAVRNATRTMMGGLVSGNLGGHSKSVNSAIDRLNRFASKLAKQKRASPALIAKAHRYIKKMKGAALSNWSY